MSKGFLLDMDGVIYRGDEMVPGADKFIKTLLEKEIPFLFLTNNSQRTRRDISTKLNRMGLPITPEHIYTSAMATAKFLASQKPNGTAYVIGEGGILTSLDKEGYSIVDENPDYVVIGEQRTISTEMMDNAVHMISEGSKLIATHLDIIGPTPSGIKIGCGAIIAMLEKATGKKAFSPGKPNPYMMREARKELQLSTDEITMVGDSLETDIIGGIQLGYQTILVLSGITQKEDLLKYSYQPNKIVKSVAEITID